MYMYMHGYYKYPKHVQKRLYLMFKRFINGTQEKFNDTSEVYNVYFRFGASLAISVEIANV